MAGVDPEPKMTQEDGVLKMGRMASWRLLRSFMNFFREVKNIHFTHAQTGTRSEERDQKPPVLAQVMQALSQLPGLPTKALRSIIVGGAAGSSPPTPLLLLTHSTNIIQPLL